MYFVKELALILGVFFVIEFEKKWGCKINYVNFSHALRMHFFPSIRTILTLHLSLAFHYELSSWLSIQLTAPLEPYRSLMVLFKYYFCQIDIHQKIFFVCVNNYIKTRSANIPKEIVLSYYYNNNSIMALSQLLQMHEAFLLITTMNTFL